MWWPWRLSAQKKILARFTLQYLEGGALEVDFPLTSPRLLTHPLSFGLEMEPLERRIGIWAAMLLREPPEAAWSLEPAIWLLAGLYNVLCLAHPHLESGQRPACIDRLRELIEQLPMARERDELIVYHAVFERFGAFLDPLREKEIAWRWLGRLVPRSPLTQLLWLERLDSRPIEGLPWLFQDKELERFVLLSLIEKECRVTERGLLRLREVMRELKAQELPSSGWPAYEALRAEFTSLRAGRV